MYLSLKNVDGVAMQHLFLLLTCVGLVLVPLGVGLSSKGSDPLEEA
jgi:hypothetical protein